MEIHPAFAEGTTEEKAPVNLNYLLKYPRKSLIVIVVIGTLFRCYGITDHWKNNDQYNFGGVSTTHALKCLRTTLLRESRGLYHSFCGTPEVSYYPNHSPVFLWGMWGLTEIFGEAEWAHRLFTLIFSVSNILLVFIVARLVWPKDEIKPLLAAFFQSFFLGPMYFGTHLDPITEFTLTPMLLSVRSSLKNKWGWACGWSIVAGLTAWVGFLQFIPLLMISYVTRRGIKTVVVGLSIAFVAGVCLMMYLLNTVNIFGFIYEKLFEVKYVSTTTWRERWLFPLQFIKTFFVSQDRLLGPLFASLAFFELLFGNSRNIFSWKTLRNPSLYVQSLVLLGGAGFFYALIGPKYVMVHIYLFIFLMPFFAILCAEFCANFYRDKSYVKRSTIKWLAFLTLAFVGLYPYGIYRSNVIHDAVNSTMFGLCAILFLVMLVRASRHVWIFVLLTASTNVSQVVNYRNEPDTEFAFCERAKKEFALTQTPVRTEERNTRAREYVYCRGIPIQYDLTPHLNLDLFAMALAPARQGKLPDPAALENLILSSLHSQWSQYQHLAPMALVTIAYHTLLGRDPGPEGERAFVQAIASGAMDADGLFRAIISSQEFRDRLFKLACRGILSSLHSQRSQYQHLAPMALVTIAYRTLLGRDPDPEGERAFVQAVVSGAMDADGLFRSIISSQEFRDHFFKPVYHGRTESLDAHAPKAGAVP